MATTASIHPPPVFVRDTIHLAGYLNTLGTLDQSAVTVLVTVRPKRVRPSSIRT